MSWTDGVDRATNYIISAVNWNALLGAAGSLMQVKNHAHGGTTGEGSQSLGPLVLEDFTDAAAPAAPSAGRTRLYTVSGKPRYRPNGGADRQIITDESTAAGDLAGTYPNPTVSKVTVGSDANGDIYYRAAGTLARLGIGAALQLLRVNSGGTAPEWFTLGNAVTTLDKKTTTTTFTNTAVETTMYSKTITANTIGATGTLRLMLRGHNLANGAPLNFTWRVKFGGTTLGTMSYLSYGQSPTAHAWALDLTIQNTSTSAQRAWASVHDNGAVGDFSNLGAVSISHGYATSAIDTTANADLVITGQFSDGTATVTSDTYFGVLELLL